MKRIICLLFVVVLLCLTLCSCSATPEPECTYCHMEILEEVSGGNILVDRDTGVLYFWCRLDSCYGHSLTPLYNADGSLKNIEDFNK